MLTGSAKLPTFEKENIMSKPVCKLTGTDGNVFSIIGTVTKCLRRHGQADKAQEFAAKAMSAGSYDEVLAMTFDYVEVR